jgi:biotin carboxyl carrier protein
MKIRVKINEQSFEVEIGDLQARPIQAIVDGEAFEVYPEENEISLPVAAPAAPTEAPRPRPAAVQAQPTVQVNAAKAVMAPLPGVILSIAVKPGDSVKPGQELCVLEAMKMRNPIRAGRTGTIAAIHINVGDTIRHNQPLMEYSD